MSTVAVPSPRDFIALVVAWPGPDEPGYVNLHYKPPEDPANPKKGGLRGRAFRDLSEFMGFSNWCAANPQLVAHTYFCLSTQSHPGKAYHGKLTAYRSKDFALKLKAIWLDIDVKPSGYRSVDEALVGLTDFVQQASIPPPSALVLSGGGVHAYWISDRPLSVAEWRPYAEGLKEEARRCNLKCDSGLTTDPARVLRLPGTTNGKTNPPKPVTLGALQPPYDFGQSLASLALTGAAAAAAITAPVTKAIPVYDLSGFVGKAPALAFAGLDPQADKLSDGINVHDDRPLDPDQVLLNCPHLQNACITRGAGYPQGLWMLDVLACTFFEDGRTWAHYVSKGYNAYSRGETDAMYDRKEADKARGIGWPSCRAFENEGAKECANCPFKGKIKSPLNLASRIEPLTEEHVNQAKRGNTLPVAAIRTLYENGADRQTLFRTLNETYAVARYGTEVLVASVVGPDISPMEPEEFHKMFANLRLPEGRRTVEISRLWWQWPGRREYLGRGVVFEPGGPLEIADDMLNLWRGFGVEPKQGDWSLMRSHILNVICSGNQDLFDYLIKWMACAVQNPNEPIGVAVAFRGAQGAGKGVVARTLGRIFGKHFAHIANGDQLTGRFNASLATSCAVFLDEALWAGDRRGEGVLKALITEPRLQLEAKFRDPIMVDNRLRIIVASNEDWCVPAGIGDRRWLVLDVANTFAGMGHREYWNALYAEIDNGGVEAMFYELLNMDLAGFDVRTVPHTTAKAQQQAHSLQGTNAWLYQVLQDGVLGPEHWKADGLTISTETAYRCYEDFSRRQRQYRPDGKAEWSKKTRKSLGNCLGDTRRGKGKDQARDREFRFAPLAECRRRFAAHIGAPNIDWELEAGVQSPAEPARQASEDIGQKAKPDVTVLGETVFTTGERKALEIAAAVGAADLDQALRTNNS